MTPNKKKTEKNDSETEPRNSFDFGPQNDSKLAPGTSKIDSQTPPKCFSDTKVTPKCPPGGPKSTPRRSPMTPKTFPGVKKRRPTSKSIQNDAQPATHHQISHRTLHFDVIALRNLLLKTTFALPFKKHWTTPSHLQPTSVRITN